MLIAFILFSLINYRYDFSYIYDLIYILNWVFYYYRYFFIKKNVTGRLKNNHYKKNVTGRFGTE